MFLGKKVLVTGGTGFLGSNFVTKLLSIGADVRVTQHRRKPLVNDPRIEYVQADLSNSEDCARAVYGQDYVIMCAAETGGAEFLERFPLRSFVTNTAINLFTLRAAFECQVRGILFISAGTVYPHVNHDLIETEASYQFFDKYFVDGWVKSYSEVACEVYYRHYGSTTGITVVRPSNVYGYNDNFSRDSSHVMAALIRKVVERQDPIEVWGDGSELRDFIFVEDFVEGSLKAINIANLEPINIASGTLISIAQLAQLIIQADGYSGGDILFLKDKPTMIPRQGFDVSKAKSQLNFETKTSIETGLSRTLTWYRQNVK